MSLELKALERIERNWMSSDDPAAMLALLGPEKPLAWLSQASPNPTISDRKLRLFFCAVSRQEWEKMYDHRSRKAVEVAERYVDDNEADHLAMLECQEELRVRPGVLWYFAIASTAVATRPERQLSVVGNLIIRASSNPGDLVFDPFLGSGTTLAAAIAEGRRGWGCELSGAYIDDYIIPRLEAHGQTQDN